MNERTETLKKACALYVNLRCVSMEFYARKKHARRTFNAVLESMFPKLRSQTKPAMKVYFNDGKIEEVDYQPGTIRIKLTRAGIDYGVF